MKKVWAIGFFIAMGIHTGLSQNFQRIPVEVMVSANRNISFRDIVVTSKGDMIITSSMGFASIIGNQFEYSFPAGGLEDKEGNTGSSGHSSNIMKDAYELHTGFKSIAAGPGEIVYAVSDNNNFGLMDFKIGRGFIVAPFYFSSARDIGKLWIDNDGDLFFCSARQFFHREKCH